MLRRLNCLLSLTLLAASLLAVPAIAQSRDAGLQLAFRRAQHLRHGINAAEWFAQAGDYSAARTNRFTDAGDIALMARLGFDNVRLSIDPEGLMQFPRGKDGMNDDFLGRLDKAVDTMIANGLAVQIDIHPQEPFKISVRDGNSGVDRFVMMWRLLAAHYATRDPNMVFFEIMNEPEVRDPYRWAGIQARAAAAIREAAPQNTLIATGPNYSDIADLLAMHPLDDGNVIYNFHFYDPHTFTHQGATWGTPWWVYEHGLPYPPTADSMAALIKEVPDPADRFQMENYWLEHWDGEHIRLLIDEAAAWGKSNNVPLICNEFGAFREHMDPASRMRWIHDVRTSLEADGIGWAMWDYRGSFGVVFKQDGQPARVDPLVVEALGLNGR